MESLDILQNQIHVNNFYIILFKDKHIFLMEVLSNGKVYLECLVFFKGPTMYMCGHDLFSRAIYFIYTI